MYIILNTADFSANNIGTLDQWSISCNRPKGITWSGLTSAVDKGANFSAVAEIDTANYELITMSVTMGATTQSGVGTSGGITISKSGSRYTITISSVTANVNISVTTKNLSTETPGSGGGDGGGGTPTPTTYTFTVNPTPTSATVTLSATGYTTVTGTGSKSITVASGTVVNWSVNASGYTTRTGNWTISGSNKTENIILSASGGTSSGIVDLATLSNVKTSDVTYTGSTGTFTSSQGGNIITSGLSGKTFVVQEPLRAGMEVEVVIDRTYKSFFILGLNNDKTLESIYNTACHNHKIMATPINLYFDPDNGSNLKSFESSASGLSKFDCTGDGAAISQDMIATHKIIFKRANDGTITIWQDGKQVLPPNNSNMQSQWAALNSIDNVYLCGQGVQANISYKINYFGNLR